MVEVKDWDIVEKLWTHYQQGLVLDERTNKKEKNYYKLIEQIGSGNAELSQMKRSVTKGKYILQITTRDK